MAARGLDQRGPMERLVKIAAVLKRAGDRGVPGERLAEIAEFTGEHRADQLKREIRHLSNQGWQIDNIADEGFPAVYRMSTVDNRLRVKLSAAQQRALQRAVLLANRADLAQRLGLPVSEAPLEVDAALPLEGHGEALDTVVRAVGSGALLRYRYNGTERIVHPQSVRTQNGKWYLRGREDDRRRGQVVRGLADERRARRRARLGDSRAGRASPRTAPHVVGARPAGRGDAACAEPSTPPTYAGGWGPRTRNTSTEARPCCATPSPTGPRCGLGCTSSVPGSRSSARGGPRRAPRRASVGSRRRSLVSTPRYVGRFARMPRVLETLRAHPNGLPLTELATRVGVDPDELREDLMAFYTADTELLLGLRPDVIEFLGSDGDDEDPNEAQAVRIIDARPAHELGVEYVDAAELASGLHRRDRPPRPGA